MSSVGSKNRKINCSGLIYIIYILFNVEMKQFEKKKLYLLQEEKKKKVQNASTGNQIWVS